MVRGNYWTIALPVWNYYLVVFLSLLCHLRTKCPSSEKHWTHLSHVQLSFLLWLTSRLWRYFTEVCSDPLQSLYNHSLEKSISPFSPSDVTRASPGRAAAGVQGRAGGLGSPLPSSARAKEAAARAAEGCTASQYMTACDLFFSTIHHQLVLYILFLAQKMAASCDVKHCNSLPRRWLSTIPEGI